MSLDEPSEVGVPRYYQCCGNVLKTWKRHHSDVGKGISSVQCVLGLPSGVLHVSCARKTLSIISQ